MGVAEARTVAGKEVGGRHGQTQMDFPEKTGLDPVGPGKP